MPALGTILSTTSLETISANNESAGITVTIDLSNAALVRIWTAAQNATVNLTGSQTAGRLLILMIANDATLPRVITLGIGFVSSGVITGVASKTSSVLFISNGTSFFEIARTVGI